MNNRKNNKIVIPAKAGIQVLNHFLNGRFSDWIPAFAGMTLLLLSVPPVFSLSTSNPEDKILSKAFSAYMDGDDKRALSYFEEVARLNPSNNAAKKGLEKVKVRLKKKEDADKAKARALARAKMKEGRGLLRTGDTVAAIDCFHAAIDAVPDHKAAKKEIAKIKKEMERANTKKNLNLTTWAFTRGTIAYLERDWAKAYRIWSERVQIDPRNLPLANAVVRAENNFKMLMMTEQEEFFRRAARAYYEQGLYTNAIESWTKLLALRPDDLEGMEGRARSEQAHLSALGKGRNDEVHDLLEEGLEEYAEQNWKKALVAFQRLSELDPDFSTAKEYIAKINQHLETVAYIPSAEDHNWRPNRPSNQSGSEVLVPEGLENFSESRRELEGQLKRDPTDIRTQQELDKVIRSQEDESERIYKDGLIAYSQGNRALAISQWKQVLIINPEHKKASAALRKARAEEERSDHESPSQ